MDIHTIPFERLTSDELAAWSAIQRAEPALDSPYFRPEFSEAIAAVRNDVEVAVLREGGRPVGFFPYQRTRRNTGRPVGDQLSDFHGLIAPATVDCDPLELVRACQLKAWHFAHLRCDQTNFARFMWQPSDSPYIDLAGGFDSYVAGKDNGRRVMAEYKKKLGKLVRDVGPLHYQHHVDDDVVFSTLLTWKIEQYRQMNVPNIFDFPWARNLLVKVRQYNREDFSPVMSVLYAGGRLAAINLGIRSRAVLHCWFPAYNVEMARYSPGLLHWIETIKAAESLGIRRIDLGKGEERYKRRLMNGASQVAEGTVDLQPAAAAVRHAWRHTRARIRTSPWARPARASAQVIRHLRHWLQLRSTHAG
jgi:CelD/BcsL family acetyltransferase involved in cellulose biosynthesis